MMTQTIPTDEAEMDRRITTSLYAIAKAAEHNRAQQELAKRQAYAERVSRLPLWWAEKDPEPWVSP